MAVLEKIRVKFGILITVLVALALLSFIIDPQTLRQAFQMVSDDNKVGEMDGKSISYKEFYEALDGVTQVAKLMGQNESGEEQQSQLRDAAWQNIFDNVVFLPKAEKAGLFVGSEEMLDLTKGATISPVLLQQAMFVDNSGNFSREALVNFVQNIDVDETGSYATIWNYLEEEVFRNQVYTKYGSLVSASTVMNQVEKVRSAAENNTTSDVDYVLAPISFADDSTITVSASEIKKYYNDRKEQFAQLANRDIEYVMWEVVPSTEDFSATREEFDELLQQFAETDNLKSFVTLNSDSKWNTYYYSYEQMEDLDEFQALGFGKDPSGVSEVHTAETSYSAVRVADIKMMPDSAHVYYKAFPISQEADADAFFTTNKVSANAADFSEFGWLTQEVIMQAGLTGFEAALTTTDKVIKLRNEANGAIIVLYVPERTKAVKKVQFATLMKNVLPSDDTYRDFQMKATEFADACEGKYEKFAQLAKEQGLPVIPVNNMVQSVRRIGPAENAREVVSWVFDKKTKAGNVSDLKIVDNKYYFVAAVTKTRKAGYTDINEVASQIKSVLMAEKSVEKKLAEVKEKISGMTSMEQIAEALGTTVSHSTGMAFGSTQSQTVDPKLVGAVASAEVNTINAVPGTIGVYVFQVTGRDNGSFFSDKDNEMVESRKASYSSQMVGALIADEAEIKDNRARFF